MSTGFGGLGEACWLLVPKFAGSNYKGQFRDIKMYGRGLNRKNNL